MKWILFAISMVFLLSGCFLTKPVVFSNAVAGRFVRADLRSPGNHVVSIEMDGELLYNFSVPSSRDHFYFFAKKPGNYSVVIDGKEFSVSVSQPKWQILIWMAADNSLEGYTTYDLEEISDYGTRTSVLVAFDGPEDSVLAMSDEGLKVLRNASINSGSGRELRDFLDEFSIDDSKKFLIIWDHGASWLGDSKYENDFSTRSVALDEKSDDALTIPELSLALSGRHFDILGFDACFMGSAEVVYQMRRVAKYVIASGDYEPGYGWDYSFLGNLTESALDTAKRVVDSFSESLRNDRGWSLSVFDTSKIDELATALKNFASEIPTPAVAKLASELKSDDDYKRYLKNIEDVLEVYENPDPLLDGLIVYSWSSGGYPMNVFLPNPGYLSRVSDSYEVLEFASDTEWLEYLKEAGL